MNMKKWLEEVKNSPIKSAMPILSFPCAQLLDVSIRDLVHSSRLQAKGMKMLAERYNTLASLSMMDLSVEAEAFGADIKFSDYEVPTVTGALVTSLEEAKKLEIPDVSAARCPIYTETIKMAKSAITDRPVFAGVIGPFSLAGRLMDVSEAMINCYTEPDMVHIVLEKATDFLVSFINEYKKSGADGVLMAEPLAGMLSPDLEKEFSEPYVREIIEKVQTDDFIVIYHNCGDNIALMADSIFSTKAAAFHFGNSVALTDMLEKYSGEALIMGNVDPSGCIRNGTPEFVRAETERIMSECSRFPEFVISSGCDIPFDSSFDNIDAFFEAVNEFYNIS